MTDLIIFTLFTAYFFTIRHCFQTSSSILYISWEDSLLPELGTFVHCR